MSFFESYAGRVQNNVGCVILKMVDEIEGCAGLFDS